MRREESLHHGGVIEVICGPMFSGKTEELIRRLRRAQIAKQDVVILKPSLDDRFSADHLVSHSAQRIPSAEARTAAQVQTLAAGADVVGIDEVQFFGPDIVPVIEALADAGARVIVAGLDMDYRAVPFGPVPELLARAEYITKTLAICVCCGTPASRSQRVSDGQTRILVGASEHYEARCRECFEAPGPESGSEQGQSVPESGPEPEAESEAGSAATLSAQRSSDAPVPPVPNEDSPKRGDSTVHLTASGETS